MSHELDFIDAMSSFGITPENFNDIIGDDVRRRFKVDGDKVKTENGSYSLKIEGNFAFGWFMTHKDGVVHNWNAKNTTRQTEEEMAETKKRMKDLKAAREKEEKATRIATAKRAAEIWASAEPKGSNDYLARKLIGLNGARIAKNTIIIPIRNGADILGLQFIGNDGAKKFQYGTPIDGGYFAMAKAKDDFSRIYIAEGFATAASVREATKFPVIVAFNAGNMKSVAIKMQSKYPDAHIVLAADNDHETRNQKKELWNVGLEKAGQAAVAIGGAHVVAPITAPDVFDWSDVHLAEGLDAVLKGLTVERVIAEDERPPEYEGEPDGADIGLGDDLEHYDPPLGEDDGSMVDNYDNPEANAKRHSSALDIIRPLGHNRREFFFFPKSAGQVVSCSATSLGRIQTLYELAPRSFWDMHYNPNGDVKDADITKYASANLIEACQNIGVYSPENTRGVGVWKDGGKTLINCGNLVTDGVIETHPSEFEGDSVYENGPKIFNMNVKPLTKTEATNLLKLCHMLKWKHSAFAEVLAGWLVIAPFGGAFMWRPHIVITGQKGSGKSTVMRDIVKDTLGAIALDVDGGTTEAGLRAALGISARPVVMDEAESETQRDRMEMDKIMSLIRKSSTGGTIVNANTRFIARSCYCLGAINPRIEQGADKDRNTMLELMKNTSSTRDVEYAELLDMMALTMVNDFGHRLIKRTFENFEALLHNIDMFRAAISKRLSDKRVGDQLGPMFAGAYSLTTVSKITKAKCEENINARDWSWFIGGQDMTDAEKLVTVILSHRAQYDHNGMSRTSSIGELIERALSDDEDAKSANKGLQGYGIKIMDDMLAISNLSPQIKKILNDTPWFPWARTLGDYVGADVNGNKSVYFFTGLNSKVTRIPLASVLEDTSANKPTETQVDIDGF